MKQSIEAARKIVNDPETNALPMLQDINMDTTFREIYRMKEVTQKDANLLVAFIIFAYDPESQKINLSKERHENKLSIAKNIGIDVTNPLKQIFFSDILNNTNEDFNNIVANYLSELTDWRWQTICSLLDYHSNIMRFANQKTESERRFEKLSKDGIVKELSEEYDVDQIAKINKSKGELLNQAIEARHKANELLAEIKKDFVATDAAVQGDFNFIFTDTAKEKTDIMQWRGFIKGLRTPRR